jgi:salicylate hydroxylase
VLKGRHIAVLGAGIGGLAAARALALRGARVTVFEQAEAIREVGAGLQISPNGMAVLRGLGLESAVAARALRAEAVVLRDYRAGRAVLRMPLDRAAGAYLLLHRAALIDVLAAGAREAGAEIVLGRRATAVTLDPPCLHFADGTALRRGLLVGADGLHSLTRQALNAAAPPFFTGQVAWRATVPLDAPEPPVVEVHMGPGRHLVRYPIGDGRRLNLVAVEEREAWAEEGWAHRDDPANLRAAFATFSPGIRADLDRLEEVHLWGLFRHPVAACWHGGGAAILGDAAHPTLPFLAQGANLALEDAWTLAAALDARDDPDAALAAYQDARQGRVRRAVDAASRNARNYHLRGAVTRRAAHLALGLAGRLAPGAVVSRFDWLYRYDATAQRF